MQERSVKSIGIKVWEGMMRFNMCRSERKVYKCMGGDMCRKGVWLIWGGGGKCRRRVQRL